MTHECLHNIEEIQTVGSFEFIHAGLYVDGSAILPQQQALCTKEFIPAHTVLCVTQCPVSYTRTRTSIQISSNLHAEADNSIRFANHSCLPNAAIISKFTEGNKHATVVLISLRDIAMGSEIQFDYASTESTLTPELLNAPCACNAPNCRKFLTGFSELSDQDKQMLMQKITIADYLLKL